MNLRSATPADALLAALDGRAAGLLLMRGRARLEAAFPAQRIVESWPDAFPAPPDRAHLTERIG